MHLFSNQFHNLVFAIGAFVLFLGLLPAAYHKTVLPRSTIVTTGGVLFWFVLNYADMAFWYAMVVQALSVVVWFYLLVVAVRDRHG